MPWSASRRAGVAQARREEADVVVERVGVGQRAELLACGSGARRSPCDPPPRRPPRAATGGAARGRVERRVDVDQVEGAIGQAREHVEVVAVDEQVVAERHARRRSEAATSCTRMTLGYARMWQGGPVARSGGACASPARGDGAPHAARGGARRRPRSPRRPRRARRARWAPAWSAAWPRPSRSPTARPARGLRARRRARPQPRALRQEPGGVVAPAAAHRALAADRRPRRQRATGSTPTCSRRSSCSRAPGAPTRARPTT